MTRHYALISVRGISDQKFMEHLSGFINKMNEENKSDFGATVTAIDERKGEEIEKILY